MFQWARPIIARVAEEENRPGSSAQSSPFLPPRVSVRSHPIRGWLVAAVVIGPKSGLESAQAIDSTNQHEAGNTQIGSIDFIRRVRGRPCEDRPFALKRFVPSDHYLENVLYLAFQIGD
jgi:hypothetical protein